MTPNASQPSTVTSARATTRVPIMVRHSGLKLPSQDDVLHAVGGLRALDHAPIDVLVGTARFSDEINAGSWDASHAEVWRMAGQVRQRLHDTPNARLIYAGMPEVAHAVAFGAYLGEHWPIEPYDYQGNDDTWAWPTHQTTLALDIPTGLPSEIVPTAGPALLRIEITYNIQESDVAAFVPEEERIADIRIVPKGVAPKPGLIRSLADVAELRRTVQMAIAALVANRPRVTVIHLFIAAPVSACVVTGQELRVRNHPPVQTYRYRRGSNGDGIMREAFRITATGPDAIQVPLTDEDRAKAVAARRDLWEPTIRDVERYADRQANVARQIEQRGGATARWYQALGGEEWQSALSRFNPSPALLPVQRVVERPTVEVTAPDDPDIEFGFQRANKRWLIGDPLVLGFERQFADVNDRRSLARVFLFHEYLHLVHGITKASAREVGKFANGLEHADYLSDLYGILHELDWESDETPELRTNYRAFQQRVAHLIDLVLRSFWAFEPSAPLEEMEFRRLRRYMNWYWQLERVRMANGWMQLAAVLVRQPVVEISGLQPCVESRRYFGSLRRFDSTVGLELGIVLDSEQLHRVKSGVNTPLAELMEAFRQHDHAAIQQVFRGVYAEIEGTGNHLPRPEQWPPE